ncbi:Pyridoxamine 5'-phosphate oxidase [Sphingobium sp. AP50]|uniref:pyridoxamine 5'-phosphate oxidase family protein n=1 Tax=Sphingobium sp. AP50 TaxID=1884369 RepID=UPI0008ABE16B|nr:pyridoxamine 5'-phosphate oxidase family protein [Sphingobium sp. AP50]SEK06225.1 Pyridoxamine 5'-phosphate oxidase [Sphingobium sp. AP50]
MDELAFAPPPEVTARIAAGVEPGDAALLPRVDESAALRMRIADFLSTSELAILSTKTAGGWPLTACMHFGSVIGERGQPVLYLFSKPDTRKLVNVAVEPRVSIMVYAPHNEPDASVVPSLQLQGLCTIIDSKIEHKYSMECQFGKVGYGFSRLLGLHKQPALRIDVVRGLWNDPSTNLQSIAIDYLQTPRV